MRTEQTENNRWEMSLRLIAAAAGSGTNPHAHRPLLNSGAIRFTQPAAAYTRVPLEGRSPVTFPGNLISDPLRFS